jgi:GT2 family glycosyltransferase
MKDTGSDGISIVIVSYNTREFMRNCLASLDGDRSGLVREVVVVDNCSTDGSVETIEVEFPSVKLIKNTSNLGYARAVNQGLKHSTGRYSLILNPDIEITEGAIEGLWSFMETNPRAGIAGAKLVNPDGSLQFSCRTFYTFSIVLLRRTFLGKLFPNSRRIRDHLMLDWDHDSDREVDWVLGACMMVRREAYEATGGMDERFFLYLEDVDWCFRMKKHGWGVYYVHSAVMKHHHRRESARLLPDRKFMSHLFSTFRFYDKWDSGLYSVKRERRTLSLVGTLVSDVIFINLAFVLAYYFRYAVSPFFEKPLFSLVVYRGFMIFVNVLCLLSFAYSGLYRKPRRSTFIRDLISITRSLLVSSLVIMAATYLTRTITYSRLIVVAFWPISALLVTTGRALIRVVHHNLRRSYFDLRRVAIVGNDRHAVALRDRAVSHPDGSYDFVGYIKPPAPAVGEELKPLIGDTADVGRLVVEHRLHEVLVCDSRLSREQIGRIVIGARRSGAEVKVVSDVTDMLIRGSILEDIGGIPVVTFPPGSLSGLSLITKSVADVLGAVAAMVVLLILAVPVFLFQSLSYRNYSAWVSAVRQVGLVLSGRRSLAGPRHQVDGESVRPGITGIWLTSPGAGDESQTDRLDMYYIQNWSVSADLEIVMLTIRRLAKLFKASGSGG